MRMQFQVDNVLNSKEQGKDIITATQADPSWINPGYKGCQLILHTFDDGETAKYTPGQMLSVDITPA